MYKKDFALNYLQGLICDKTKPNVIIISSCHAISADIPDPLSPPLPIVHRIRQVLGAAPRILTELLYVGSSRLPCFCSAI